MAASLVDLSARLEASETLCYALGAELDMLREKYAETGIVRHRDNVCSAPANDKPANWGEMTRNQRRNWHRRDKE